MNEQWFQSSFFLLSWCVYALYSPRRLVPIIIITHRWLAVDETLSRADFATFTAMVAEAFASVLNMAELGAQLLHDLRCADGTRNAMHCGHTERMV